MRLDKFLKVSRIIKRRTLAKEVCDNGRVSINGNPAKASSDVAVGNEVKIRFGQKLVTFEVLQLKETTRKEEAEQMYRILSEESLQTSDE